MSDPRPVANEQAGVADRSEDEESLRLRFGAETLQQRQGAGRPRNSREDTRGGVERLDVWPALETIRQQHRADQDSEYGKRAEIDPQIEISQA